MLELFEWKEREIRNLKRDIEGLLERVMSSYGIEEAYWGRLWEETQSCEDEGSFYIELLIPHLELESMKIYLLGENLMIVGRKSLPYLGSRSFRKVIRLPFVPKEGGVLVNYREDKLLLKLIRPKKKVYKLRIVEA
ncbi:MAG: hypothetical protein ACK4WB_00600 [Desulfatiglandales bacterium]